MRYNLGRDFWQNEPKLEGPLDLTRVLEIQTDEFWQDVTLPMLETVRRRLRVLVKLIEYKKRTLVYSDFEDSTGAAADIAVISVGTDMEAFRRKARLFLKPHENHIL
jgi:type I restriction enzyme, R subunit